MLSFDYDVFCAIEDDEDVDEADIKKISKFTFKGGEKKKKTRFTAKKMRKITLFLVVQSFFVFLNI